MQSVLISSDGTLDPPAPYVDLLRNAGFKVCYARDNDFALGLRSERETVERLQGAAAVIAWAERYTEQVLAQLPDLKVIARAGVGVDNVDLSAATCRRIVVTITPNANHEAVAEHALALILALAKSIVAGDRAVRAGQWPVQLQTPLRGKTLGLVGLGRIGRSTAVRALAMRMNVIATEKCPVRAFVEQHGIELVGLDTLLERADYVSLHCPLTDQTRGMINAQKLEKMKPEAALINTARGGLVVEHDLVDALRSRRIRAAGLDAFQTQPLDASDPLLTLDNVVVSPHNAGCDSCAMEEMGIEAARCIIDLSCGRWPRDAVVNTELEDRWKW